MFRLKSRMPPQLPVEMEGAKVEIIPICCGGNNGGVEFSCRFHRTICVMIIWRLNRDISPIPLGHEGLQSSNWPPCRWVGNDELHVLSLFLLHLASPAS